MGNAPTSTKAEQTRVMLHALGLYPTPQGVRGAQDGREALTAGVMRDIEKLSAGDLLAVYVLVSTLAGEAQQAI